MTTNPTPADVDRLIAEAEAALEGVTDGPWLERDTLNCTVSTEEGWNIGYYIAKWDRKFIAWARNNVPALIAALRAMQAERDDMALIARKANEHLASVKAARDAAEAKLAEVEKERDSAKGVGITAIEVAEAHIATLTAQVEAMRGALTDMWAGWRYIRMTHGDLPGVGWDRCDQKARAALTTENRTDG